MSYSILLQENMSLTCSFIHELAWPDMPSFLYKSTSPFWILLPGIAVFPILLKKKIGDIRFLAIFGFSTIIFVTGVIVGYALDPYNNPIDDNIEKFQYFRVKNNLAKNRSKEFSQHFHYFCLDTLANKTYWMLIMNYKIKLLEE